MRKLCLFCCIMIFFGFWSPIPAFSSVGTLEKTVAAQQKKQQEQRKALERLTDGERALDSRLAEAEKLIAAREAYLEKEQGALQRLLETDDAAQNEYDALLFEQKKTEQAQKEVLQLLWEIACKREVVGGREMAEWAIIDREHAWGEKLLLSLEDYRRLLDVQETELAVILGRRQKLSEEMRQRLDVVQKEKTVLLEQRVAFAKRLTEIRRSKDKTASSLKELESHIAALNKEIGSQSASIEKRKGKLPWPAQGKLVKRFSSRGAAKFAGIGLTVDAGTPVFAIASGTVVHNDILRGFGTVVIIQHGTDFHSLYAYLSSSPLAVGSSVDGLQQIGVAGFYPLLKTDGLYFELRFKAKPINPEQWLKS